MTADAEQPFAYQLWARLLAEEMRTLNSIFAAEQHDRGQRYGAYLIALSTIAGAMRDLPDFPHELLPLQDLARRLDALASGQKKALLPISRTNGGRPDYSTMDWNIVGRSAATVQILMDAGFAEDEACDLVAKTLRTFGVKGRRQESLTKATIRDWRSGVLEFGTKPKAQEDFESSLQTFKGINLASLNKAQLRKLLPTMLKPFGRVMSHQNRISD